MKQHSLILHGVVLVFAKVYTGKIVPIIYENRCNPLMVIHKYYGTIRTWSAPCSFHFTFFSTHSFLYTPIHTCIHHTHYTHTHTHTHPPSNQQNTHTYSHRYTDTHPPSHNTHTHTHPLTSHTHTHTHTDTHTHPPSHKTHTHTHTHIHTHTHTPQMHILIYRGHQAMT
ncbi:mCG1030081 [Mus musculus]|jgi:hypothetical protein|nr:mCG1030081 [Mus musculus]